MNNKKIGITELVLRDAHQSLLATRLRYEDMESILTEIDNIGYWSVESGAELYLTHVLDI